MKTLVCLLGLVLIVEGLPYVAFPEAMQNWLQQLTRMKPGRLRIMGLIAMAIGLFLCYVTQRTGFFS
ncbi:MAG: DUF2065 domain-containing protein [Proteobacteria bacterium]|nr:DUF2065 domain-containing protein [Pseudomonadota bacterium]MBU1710375.1 DUF2065 domain-containing protein [Pseudomonadota bacterium]